MAKKYVLNGFDVAITYTLPVPRGHLAIKERVIVANNVDKANIGVAVATAQAVLGSLAIAIAEADPFQGWAPFAGGTDVQPDWTVIDVPDAQ